MKASWCRAAIVAFVFTVSLSPAMALGPKLSGGNTWPGISQRVDHGTSTIAASPARAQGPNSRVGTPGPAYRSASTTVLRPLRHRRRCRGPEPTEGISHQAGSTCLPTRVPPR